MIAIIPGIFKGSTTEASHSFIQILDGKNAEYRYNKFDSHSFKAHPTKFQISVDNNFFSLDGININIQNEDNIVKGNVKFERIIKWPDTYINPGSMGFYNYLLFMQCYSQVCAIDMTVNGKIVLNDREIIFNNGKGYIEKNWGKAFPYSWMWTQANCFDNANAAISVSIGHIPFITGSFRGFLIGLMLENDFYAFTTINRSKIDIVQKRTDAHIKVYNRNHILDIDISTEKDKFMLCMGPRDNEMIPLVEENLKSQIKVSLRERNTNKLIFSGSSHSGGVEYGGEQMLIIN